MIHLRELLAILKGLRNGLEYGSKVRFVHSLVITLLFKKINKKQLKSIVRFAIEHGKNLGMFVGGYKTLLLLLEKCFGKHSLNNFVAGFVCGLLVFGKETPVNYQIVLYLFSRVMVGLVTLIYKKYFKGRWEEAEISVQRKFAYPLLAAFCWGFVMWIFTVDKSVLQSSLVSSMQFLYIESNHKIKSLKELVPYWPKIKRG